MQQARRSDAGFLGDLSQRGVASPLRASSRSATARMRCLRILAFWRGACHRPMELTHGTPSSNQPSEHTLGRFPRCDKGLSEFNF